MNNSLQHYKYGLHFDIPHAIYHDFPDSIISNSYLGKLKEVPAKAKEKYAETDSFFVGKALHCLLLDGQMEFNRQYVVAANRGHQTKADKQYWEEFELYQRFGRVVITIKEYDQLLWMRDSVYNNPNAKKWLKNFHPEVSIFWKDEETGIDCKARPDGIEIPVPNVIFELKTGRTAEYRSFSKDILKYGYHREAAIFSEGYCAVTDVKFDDIIYPFIVVEKVPPFRCEVYGIDQELLWEGRREFHELLELELLCRSEGKWPAYKHRSILTITKPKWL